MVIDVGNVLAQALKRILALTILTTMLALVSHAEAISPRQLLETIDFGAPVLSPDGNSVAFRIEQASVERNNYDTAWYVQEMDGASPPRRVAEGGVPLRSSSGVSLPANAVWSPDSRWIYFRALLDGRIDIWKVAADGSGAEPITLDPADVREFSLSEDGDVLTYGVSATREEIGAAEEAEYDRGIRIDATIPIGQSLFRSGYIEGRLATQRLRDNEVIRYGLLSDTPVHWKKVDLRSGVRRDISSPETLPASPAAVEHSTGQAPWKLASEPRGDRVALLTRVGERGGLRHKPDVELTVVLGRGDRQTVKCASELCVGRDITGIQWRPGTSEVLFTVTEPNDGYAQSIHGWNVESNAVRLITRSRGLLGGGRDRFSACGVSHAALACVSADPGQPPRLERIDLETGRRNVLFEPNETLALDMAKSKVQLLRWADSSGQQFTGWFYPAAGAKNYQPPLFISYYWCLGFVRGGVGDEMPFASLAADGISSLCINRAPTRLDAIERHELGRTAVESAIELLASEGHIDRSKVGMGGLSFGSEITMWTLMNSDVLTSASVSSSGISPLFYLLLSLHGEAFTRRLEWGWQLGSPDGTPERWRRFSPAFNIERIQSPVLMQLPEQEYIHSLDYVIPLIQRGRADVYVFPHEPHQKFQPRHKLAVYERNVDWFRFWLQGFEDNDPSKADQYQHWREMRTRLNERAEARVAP